MCEIDTCIDCTRKCLVCNSKGGNMCTEEHPVNPNTGVAYTSCMQCDPTE